MSIQAECRAAMHRLAEQGDLFTEIDVANEASSDAWSTKHFDQAVKFAYNVLQGDYKQGRLVRFGPVTFQGNIDYARRGTKILYTDAENGLQELVTPNGTFPVLTADRDALSAPGRRSGTNRDDTKPWANQNVTLKRVTPKGPPIDTAPLMKRIAELESEVNRLRKGVAPCETVEVEVDDSLKRLADILAPALTERVKESFAEAMLA